MIVIPVTAPKTFDELEEVLKRKVSKEEAFGFAHVRYLRSERQFSVMYLNGEFSTKTLPLDLTCIEIGLWTVFFDKYFPSDPQGRWNYARWYMEEWMYTAHYNRIENWLTKLGFDHRQERLTAYKSGYATTFSKGVQSLVSSARGNEDFLVNALRRRRRMLFTNLQRKAFDDIRVELASLNDIEIELPYPHCDSALAFDWVDIEVGDVNASRTLAIKYATRTGERADWAVDLKNCLGDSHAFGPVLGVYCYVEKKIIGAIETREWVSIKDYQGLSGYKVKILEAVEQKLFEAL